MFQSEKSKFLKNGMYLVYLDQCVLSRFLEKAENQPWRELRELVLIGNSKRRILCPTSLEHLIETSSLPKSEAVFLDELIEKLSFGWALSGEATLVAQQIISKLRNRPISRAHFLEVRPFRRITYTGTIEKLRELKASLDQNNAWKMQAVNDLNALIRNGRKPGVEMLHCLIKMRTDQRVRMLLSEVLNLQKAGRVVLRAENYNENAFSWTSKVVYELVTKHRLVFDEVEKLYQILMSSGLEFLPTLRIKAELEAIHFFLRKKITPGDQYDITRAACALPYADVFVTDGANANAIRELGMDIAYKVEVFSMKMSDLGSLVARLGRIVL